MDFDALRWQLEVLPGQECHLLGLQQNWSHESKGRSGKGSTDGKMECFSCGGDHFARDCALPAKVASQVERAKAKAKAR